MSDWGTAFLHGVHVIIPDLLWQTSVTGQFAPLFAHKDKPPVLISLIPGISIPFVEKAAHVIWPIDDKAELPDLQLGWTIANVGLEGIEQGRGCVVHCFAGINRSGLMCGMILHLLTGKPGPEIIEMIRAGNPQALSNKTFYDYVNSLRREA